MRLGSDSSVCAVVYNHSKGALLVGTKGNSKSWQFPTGLGGGDGQSALDRQFGLQFTEVDSDSYEDDSTDVHKVDCGTVVIPVEKCVQKGNTYIRQQEYSKASVYVYEYNRNASGKIAKGIKDKEFSRVRWVKLNDMFKRELAPATLTVLNRFMERVAADGDKGQ